MTSGKKKPSPKYRLLSTDRFKGLIYPKKNGQQVAYFYDDIYCINFHILWPTTGTKMMDYIEGAVSKKCANEYPTEDGEFVARCLNFLEDGRSDIVMGFTRHAFTQGIKYKVDCIGHECIHAAIAILESRAVKIDAAHDESLAYYQSMLVRRLLEIIA